MNSDYILEKEKLKTFLRAVMRDFCLVAPHPAENGDFLLQEIKDLKNIDLSYDITSNTLKEFFFPQRETIFNYRKKKNKIKIIPRKDNKIKETVFFGLRSCDVKAVSFQDKFFLEEPQDNLYWQKRDKGILVSLACNKPPRQNCFCAHTQNNGPVLEKDEGFDLQFIDLAEVYLVEIGTEKGRNFIKRYKSFFIQADKNVAEKKRFLKEGCRKEFAKIYDFSYIYEKLKNEDLKELWAQLSKRCTNCGGCEFICPTCFCFYTQDINYSQDRGERLKGWDSCTFEAYSRMAGEVNPHEKNSDRISRRFFCKLYNCYNWFGVFACTGCGRCSFACPVNLDMESFIASLLEGNQYRPLLKE